MSKERNYHEKISRLPGLPEPLDGRGKALFDDTIARGSSVLNLHLLTAHAPVLSEARKPFVQAMRSGCDVPRLYREIAITRAAQIAGCAYEVHHHLPFVTQCGMREEAAQALDDWQQHRDMFDAPQLAVLGFVEDMCTSLGEVSDATFAQMQAHFTPAEIVELATCASAYFGTALFMKAMRLEQDPEDRKPAPGKF